MAFRIQIRRDISSKWLVTNPVLLGGEFGYETNTSKIKIGDGVTAWNNLTYWEGGSSIDLTAVDSHIIPATGGVYDLGATGGYSWGDLYLSGNTIYLGDAKISAMESSVSMDSMLVGGPTGDGGVIVSATGGYLTVNGIPVAGSTGGGDASCTVESPCTIDLLTFMNTRPKKDPNCYTGSEYLGVGFEYL